MADGTEKDRLLLRLAETDDGRWIELYIARLHCPMDAERVATWGKARVLGFIDERITPHDHHYLDAKGDDFWCAYGVEPDSSRDQLASAVQRWIGEMNRARREYDGLTVDALRSALECDNCKTGDMGDCPVCYRATGNGCPHGELCEPCAEQDKAVAQSPGVRMVEAKEIAYNALLAALRERFPGGDDIEFEGDDHEELVRAMEAAIIGWKDQHDKLA